MKAAFIETTGGPEVLQYGTLPDPVPGSGQVRVRIAAASVNPVDTYIRGGKVAMDLPLPFIPGCDLAGTVDAVGPGTSRFRVGDRVWGSNQGVVGRQGTLAEYCCVNEAWLYPLPEGVAEADAAAVALVGITAHLGLFSRAHTTAADNVFVNGGTGGVGACVVQMAKAVGARVIATVGSPEKAALARDLGADHAINYKTDDVPARVKELTDGHGVDVYYETQPPTDFDRTVEMMANNGRIVVMAGRAARPVFPNGPFYVKGLTLTGFVMYLVPAELQRTCAEDMNRWLVEKKLRALVGRTFTLDQAADAHRLQEENTLGKSGTLSGKIVVRVS